MRFTIAAFYRFLDIADPAALQQVLKPQLTALDICGTLLIAPEGINGTLAGAAESVEAMLDLLATTCGLSRDDVKFSHSEARPFNRLKVRLKREIITFNQPQANPALQVGAYVKAADWNALLDDPDVLLLDTRNDYETAIGTFAGATVPPLATFTEFAGYVRQLPAEAKQKKVAMFCTGGIRCEKASSFMLAEGFGEVYHLQGGILKYLEEVPQTDSRWQGDCYVFDRRMSVGHGLVTGRHTMCFNCGRALDETDRQHVDYEPGVACAHCAGKTNGADKERFRMRQRQLSAA